MDNSGLLPPMAATQGPRSADPMMVHAAAEQSAAARPEIPPNYVIKQYVGGGAYGKVYLAEDTAKKDSKGVPAQVAVKWIRDFARDPLCGKRTLREIKLLSKLRHENIMHLHDLAPVPGLDFDDVYIIMPYMQMDLQKVIYSSMRLSSNHVQAFVCQICRGLKYLHSAGVWHRDLKPGNILANKDCTIMIADFGLARGHSNDTEAMSEYVVTRWYRAPEIFLVVNYNEAVDLWSVGCIHSELLLRKPLFPGKDIMDMLKRIVSALGFSMETDMAWLTPEGSNSVSQEVQLLQAIKPDQIKGQSLEDIIIEKVPDATAVCFNFLRRLLVFNPSGRMSATEALDHEYLRHLHDPQGEKIAPKQFPWEFDSFEPSKRKLQDRVYAECAKLHPGIIQRDQEQLKLRGFMESAQEADGTGIGQQKK